MPVAPPVEFPAPSPRVTDTLVPDDEVVFLQPSAPTGTFPVVPPQAVSGSPQPVWFRVVRRDGEPVHAAVVALLDDHGREVDTAKTAVDGGGELHSPHAGRFLMIVSADGYQPRAAILTVDDAPVELALLLPRSAVVSGTVRSGGEPVRDARVAVRQDHDAVDEALTGGDGRYRFDDLAEGTYTVAASGCVRDRRGAVEPRRGRRRWTSTWTSRGRTAHADRMEHVDGRLAGVEGVELYWQAWLPGGAPRGVLLICPGMGEHSGRYATVVDTLVPDGWAVYGMDHRGPRPLRWHPRARAALRGLPRRLRHVPVRRRRASSGAAPVPARAQHGRPDRARLRARPPGRPRRPGALRSRAACPAGVPRDAGGGVPARPGGADDAPGRRGPLDDQPRRGRRRRLPAPTRWSTRDIPRSRSPWRCSTR